MSFPQTKLDLRRARVVVVDDSPKASEILCTILRGFHVREPSEFTSIEAAKQFAQTQPVDLILADCEMPGEGGIEFARWLRSDPNKPNFSVPIVLLSAYASFVRAITARDAGANMILAKPVAPSALLSRIEWVARNPRPFVVCETYCGPDRRFKAGLAPNGMPERRADAIALTADAERALSQNDIDSLFG